MSRWALITGAARRIGRAIALDLAQNGWDIVIHYHTSQTDAASLAEDIQALGRNACLAEIDLANGKAVTRLIPQLTAELGPLKALVNNASRFVPDSTDDSPELHEAINVTAPRLLCDAFYQSHQGTHWPQSPAIVNLLDSDASAPQFTSYNASRAKLAEMTKIMAHDFAPLIRVNGVAPGPTLPGPRQSPEHFDRLVQQLPLKKASAPEDIAAAVNFLIGNASITGTVLHVDSGAHLAKKI